MLFIFRDENVDVSFRQGITYSRKQVRSELLSWSHMTIYNGCIQPSGRVARESHVKDAGRKMGRWVNCNKHNNRHGNECRASVDMCQLARTKVIPRRSTGTLQDRERAENDPRLL